MIIRNIALPLTIAVVTIAHSLRKTDPPRVNDHAATAFARNYLTEFPQNATSCAACHAVPAAGGSSRVVVMRTRQGFTRGPQTANAKALERQAHGALEDIGVKSARIPLNAFGDAYVEAMPGGELLRLAEIEPKETHGRIHGQATVVTVLEAKEGTTAIGRFGWKAQHASLVSASADALRHELGVSNQFFPVAGYSIVKSEGEPESNIAIEKDLNSMVQFLRSLEPIPPDSVQGATESAQVGSRIFDQIGCSICHVRTLRTAPAGTKLDGGTIMVSEHLGSREIHPFSDFLLHDVGTGDGIVENIRPQDYDARTANKFRTPPLWGLRYRTWLMHDGKSVTYRQAIVRHGGEASEVTQRYIQLPPIEKEELTEFLNSL